MFSKPFKDSSKVGKSLHEFRIELMKVKMEFFHSCNCVCLPLGAHRTGG